MRSLLPNALLVARREYLVRVRSRAFVISTIILAVIAFGAAVAPAVLNALDRGATTKIAIHVDAPDLAIDPVGAANTVLNAGALQAGQAGDAGRQSFDVSLAPDLARARADLRAGRYAGILVIGRAASGKLTFDYVSDISPAGRQAVIMQLTAVWIAIEDGLQRSGLTPSTSGGPYERFEITSPDVTAPPPPTEVQSVGQLIVATVLIILIFITVMTYGMWIAVSVAEEKNSRVMELMLSAASPAQMLAGKVVGVGSAGLTQYVAIVGSALVGLLVARPVATAFAGAAGDAGVPLGGLSLGILLAFLVFFALGFTLYALLYAAAGSLVSRQEDVQQVAMPMIVLAMAGYFLASFAVNGIEASWVAPLSFVPFFAPYLMVARLTVGHVEAWELVLSVAILIATIALAVFAAARIYRAGVLVYGQRPGFRTFYRALRIAK